MTFALTSAKHSAAHRPRIGEGVKPNKEKKALGVLGPPDSSVQFCGDSSVAETWINGHHALGHKFQAKIDRIQKL